MILLFFLSNEVVTVEAVLLTCLLRRTKGNMFRDFAQTKTVVLMSMKNFEDGIVTYYV